MFRPSFRTQLQSPLTTRSSGDWGSTPRRTDVSHNLYTGLQPGSSLNDALYYSPSCFHVHTYLTSEQANKWGVEHGAQRLSVTKPQQRNQVADRGLTPRTDESLSVYFFSCLTTAKAKNHLLVYVEYKPANKSSVERGARRCQLQNPSRHLRRSRGFDSPDPMCSASPPPFLLPPARAT
jgi:hypothetical protein